MLRNYFTEVKNNKGFAVLTAVILVAAAAIGFIAVSLLFTRAGYSGVDLVHRVNQVYYAVEGAMYDTLQHIQNDGDWPENLNYSDTYRIGLVTIRRTVLTSGNQKEVDITAERGDARRRLLAEVTILQGGARPIDVILTLDTSGSMDDDGCENNIDGVDEYDEFQPAGDVKVAAVGFVDRLNEGQDLVGLTKFTTNATQLLPLSSNFNVVDAGIGSLCGGWGCDTGCESLTNIGEGILLSREELDAGARVDSIRAMVLLSDGIANRPANQVQAMPPAPTHVPPAQYPVQYALYQAELAANADYPIFTISLGTAAGPGTEAYELMGDIADLTDGLHFYAPTGDDLDAIFAEINEILAETVTYSLREELPGS
ncbi:VWA domain-containing protein [Patescibacteria group bacterium]|nr:VWA domain-containing protein [Patescibacteria group bacterium]MBU1867958.1 VWA domain-containing protein [Patescibacteria group bacterium]